ncbi:MAG TPA: hydroxyisourate hydrolase [Bacteroidia bacterium]|nr:hydroxyisourate hydrolase [Bacteroidia bacterium]
MSQLTTHILDTCLGKPAEGIEVYLAQKNSGEWNVISKGISNKDGRITDLLSDKVILAPGIYRLQFETGAYFKRLQTTAFYPSVSIEFEISDASHYHVPLLLNPYGYSTYRGS